MLSEKYCLIIIKMSKFVVLFLLLVVATAAIAQTAVQPTYRTQRTSNLIKIDGSLLEEDWQNVSWNNNFTQREPANGFAPSQASKFAVLYDNENLYVAIYAQDSVSEKIESRLARRDSRDGDMVGIELDSYNDKRTSFMFLVSAAGVKSDALSTDDGNNEDNNWNPIWEVKTTIVSDGWIAEMRIPMDQLRFDKSGTSWGMQVARYVFRKQELSLWANFPSEQSGWVSHFGTLTGLDGIAPKKQIEFTPYTVGKYHSYKAEPGNPFLEKGHEFSGLMGLDGKIGITNDFTIDFTIMPDFGQVEADPSEVNLSGFESYFSEKRPFFVEGGDITQFRLSNFGGSLSRDNLFYSRRIGHGPSYWPDYNSDNQYLKMPQNSRILGAVKFTGKTKHGWSVGLVESLTAQEFASLKTNTDHGWESERIQVEPLTNYLLGRVQKDINKGNTQIGAMLTATNRDITTENLEFLPKSAYTGGIDFAHFWKDKKYYLRGNLSFSTINGDTAAIDNLQTSHRRYMQRPDADYLHYDPTRTNLSGNSGELAFGRGGSKGWRYLLSGTWRSPGFDSNDLGFMRTADRINELGWVGYRWDTPFSIFRNMNLDAAQWIGHNFGSDLLYWGVEMNWNTNFKNYWSVGLGQNYDGPNKSMSELRGGPMYYERGGYSNYIVVSSDERKKLQGEIGMWNYWGDEKNARRTEAWLNLNYRPIQSLKISVNTRIEQAHQRSQYVTQVSEDINGATIPTQYIFGSIDQRNFVTFFRIDYSITPDMSIQYYGQPFVGAGDFSNYKTTAQADSKDYAQRFEAIPAAQMEYDTPNETFKVTTPNYSYNFSTPEFNTKHFISNLVLRWEYRPGSILFLVWSQGREHYLADGKYELGDNLNKLFHGYPENIFLVKLSYRIPI
ncbi:MAG: hypothetical protein RIS47_1965 [Bacteroidota bacterium]